MHLLTAYRLSNFFYAGSLTIPFQGLIQGNSIVSPRFMLITILLIRCLCNKELAHLSESLISKTIYYLAGLIFTNDSEFNIMNIRNESIMDIINRALQVLTIWQRNLTFTRGQLELQKCY